MRGVGGTPNQVVMLSFAAGRQGSRRQEQLKFPRATPAVLLDVTVGDELSPPNVEGGRSHKEGAEETHSQNVLLKCLACSR